ncbi:Ig-like domain-containing protein [Colwellia psychrerythraea]|nr:Ig-like domain-containing protein [Colwellia psychrerythraea]
MLLLGCHRVDFSPSALAVIQISPAEVNSRGSLGVTLAKGSSQQYIATGIYRDGSSEDISDQVDWTSSDSDTATISNSGLAVGSNVGTTTIRAHSAYIKSNTSQVIITSAVITELQLTPAISSIAKGQHQEYQTLAIYSDNTTEDISQQVDWLIGDENVVIMDEEGSLVGSVEGESTVQTTLDGLSSNLAELTVTSATVTSIQVTPSKTQTPLGTSIQFTVMANYSDTTVSDITEKVTWQVSDSAVLSIDGAGLGLANKEGEVSFSAYYESLISNVAELTVTTVQLTEIQVTPASNVVPLGNTVKYLALGTYTDGSTIDITDVATWLSSDIEIATILAGSALANNVGDSTITAQHLDINSNETVLTVTSAILTAIQVTPADSTIAIGFEQQYQAIGIYSDLTTLNITNAVSWLSSDINISTVVDGNAQGVTLGNTSITASLDTVESNIASLSITSATLVAINISSNNSSIANGLTEQYQAIGDYSDGSSVNITTQVSWLSSDTSIVTITGGLAAGKAVGTSTVSASHSGVVSNVLGLTINDEVLTEITLTPNMSSIAKGNDQQFVAMGTFSDGSTVDITAIVSWNSSDTGIATIVAGTGVGVNTGGSTISANHLSIQSNTADLTVTAAILSSLQISASSATIIDGNTLQYTAMGTYSDSSIVDLTASVNWLSSDTGVATIVSGLAEGVTTGTSTISANLNAISSNDASLSVFISVKKVIGSSSAFAAIKTNKTVVTWGNSNYGADSSGVQAQLSGVIDIGSTDRAFAAIKGDGSVVTWGDAVKGADSSAVQAQLTSVEKISGTSSAFAAIKAGGTVVTWGEVGEGSDSSAAQAQLTNVESITGTSSAFAALKSDGSVVTWGYSWWGGDSSTVQAQLTNVAEIVATDYAFAALKPDGSVVTWGSSTLGGDSSSVQAQLTNVVAISSTDGAFAAVKLDGSVVTWGNTSYGSDSSTVQAQLNGVKMVLGSAYAFAAVKNDGSVVTWGDASYGGDSSSVQAQLTNVETISGTYGAFAVIKLDGSVVAWGTAGLGGDSSAVQTDLTNVDIIYSNRRAFVAIKLDGSVITWGDSGGGGDSSAIDFH